MTNPLDVVAGECTCELNDLSDPSMGCVANTTVCRTGAGMAYPSMANNRPVGMTCYTADAGALNPVYIEPNVVTGPCHVSDPESVMIDIGGILVPLSETRVSATYSGGAPPTTLVSGVLSGFLSEATAQSVILPPTLPMGIGGESLYSLMAAGTEAESSCCRDVAHCPGAACPCLERDDRDTYMGVSGFWFYFNFTAERVGWAGP